MPTAVGPNIEGQENLVFGYDLGDTKNSFKGEPTENLFATTAMEFKDDYGVYTNNIESGTDNIGKYFIKDTVNAPWYTGLRIYQNGVYPLTAGVSYVLSFECRSPQSGWSWSYDANASGGGWSGNDLGRASNTNLVFDKTGGITYTSDMVNTWQRVSYRVTMKDASVFTGASAYPHDSFFTNANNTKIYYRNAQLEVGRTTPTRYVNGTRSSTQGLLDLTGNSTIDLSNISFDSNAQITFDGTGDHIALTGNILNVDSFTVEAVVNITSEGNYNKPIFVAGDLSTAGIWFFKHRSGLGNRLVMHGYDGVNPRIDVDSINQVPDAENTYVAVTFNGSAYQLYMNGEPEDSPVVDNKVGATTTNYIGKQGGTYLNGDIPMIKIYTRGLTAEEVKSNYNAIKGRFNI
jgi:hypothetical protein